MTNDPAVESSLARRTVAVAGAAGGMGRAVAIAAAREGMRVLLLGRNRAALEATAAAIAAIGKAAEIGVADAADAAALGRVFAEADSPDVLVNAVGTNIAERALHQLTPASWAGMVEANLTAAFNLTQAVLPAMRRRGDGLIIHIASIAAVRPDMSGAAYQAAKAGVLALNHAITEEAGRDGVRATAILPGLTNTPLLDRRPVPPPAEARAAALQPDDIAATCLFVMRLPASAHVTEIRLQPTRR